jgi:hypothetical protein
MLVLVVGVVTVVRLMERPHLASPQAIGVHLVKSVSQLDAGVALDGLRSRGDLFAYASEYNDPFGNTVTVWGSIVWPLFEENAQAKFDSFFSTEQLVYPARPLSGRAPIATGSAGGQAECASITSITPGGASVSGAVCKWVGSDMWLEMLFLGFSRSDSDALVPGLLSAIVNG